jgi:hypothetical protein
MFAWFLSDAKNDPHQGSLKAKVAKAQNTVILSAEPADGICSVYLGSSENSPIL